MEIVILGTAKLHVVQVETINGLLKKHGLPDFDGTYTYSKIWNRVNDNELWLACTHYKVDVSLIAGNTAPEVQRFMLEMGKLAGVYISGCPACGKENLMEHNKKIMRERGILLGRVI